MNMIWHQMSFNYFNTFITAQLFYNISDIRFILIINYFSSILWCEDDMIFDKHANLKYKFGNRHFWAEGYYVSTVGLNEATIKKYIQEQEKHDIAMDKLSVKEYEDPFKG